MSRVAVNPNLLQWAKNRAGIATADVLEVFPAFEAWLTGETQPTLRQLEEYARRTLTPFGYFFLDEPPEDKLPIPDFRTVGNAAPRRPSPNLLETVQTIHRRQLWLREYLESEKAQPLGFVGSAGPDSSILEVAASIRQALGLGPAWARKFSTWNDALRGLRDATEAAGIAISISGVVGMNNRRTLDPSEFRGFAIADEFAPFVFVNGADAKSAQMFTIAHELAHVWRGSSGVSDLPSLLPPDNADLELFCNEVAAELLVPRDEFLQVWVSGGYVEEQARDLSRRFKVSPIVIARRAESLRLLSRGAFFAFYNEYTSRELRAPAASGGDFYVTQEVRIGRYFSRAVARATAEGRLLEREAQRLTGLFGETFERFINGVKDRP